MKMRLCFIVNSDSIHSQKWVSYFVARGHEVHVISTGRHVIPGTHAHAFYNELPGTIRAPLRVKRVRDVVARIKPDLVSGQPLGLGFYAVLSGKKPVTAGGMGSDVYVTGRSPWGRHHIAYAMRHADLLTADSQDLKTEMVRQGADPDNVMLVTHGVDTKKFRPLNVDALRKHLGLQGKKVVLAARYFEPPYDLPGIANAFPAVLKRVPDAVLVYIGKGSLEKTLKELVLELGIREHVRFLPPVKYADLPRYLQLADAYMSASVYESTSITLLEAMSCGLAPVVSDLESNVEWIQDNKNGWVFKRRDYAQMAEKIVDALFNPRKRQRFGQLNRRTIQRKAEYAREMRRVEKSYEDLVRAYRHPFKM